MSEQQQQLARLGRATRTVPWVALLLALALAPASGLPAPAPAGQPVALAEPPRRGGTFALALVAPDSLDPARASTPAARLLAGNLFDGLTGIDPGGAVVPAAASGWTSDPTLRRWEFTLRAGATFSNGSPVEAADFKYAWERLVRRDPPAAGRELLSTVLGYADLAAGRASGLAGVTAPSPTTLVVELAVPFAGFPAVLADPRLPPVPRRMVEADPDAFAAKPAGNGPFRLGGAYRKGEPLKLRPRPEHPADGPYLDEVRVDTVPDPLTAWLEFQNGLVQFAPLPLDHVGAARALYSTSADGRTEPGVLLGPELTTWWLGMDVRGGPLADPRVRRAIASAIDRDRLAAAFEGAFSPAHRLVPPATPGAGEVACPACAYQPTEARTLLTTAKPGPLRLTLPDAPVERQLAASLVADLAAAGLDVQLDPVPPDDYQERLAKGDLDLFLTGWSADYPRPDAFLFEQFTTGGNTNHTGFANPGIDHLLGTARTTPDESERWHRYQQAETAILEAAPATPLLVEHHTAILAPGLLGTDLTPWGTLDLATIHVPR